MISGAGGFALFASAEPPWNVDDPGVTSRGVLTLYDSVQIASGPTGRTVNWPSFAATFGATDRLEIGLGFTALTSSGPALIRGVEWSDLGISVKRLMVGSPEDPRLAAAVQATFPLGNGSSSSHSQSAWIAGHGAAGANRLTWNVGGTVGGRDRLASAFYGIVVDRPIDGRSVAGVELSGSTAEFRGERQRLEVGVGYQRDALPNVNVQARFGTSVVRPGEWTVFIGLTFDVDVRSRAVGR
ncbi:MAG: hypothetical protein SNJ76_09495 [Fimbriimonadaceae bacterium]